MAAAPAAAPAPARAGESGGQARQALTPGSTDHTSPWVTHMPPRTYGTPWPTHAALTQSSISRGLSTPDITTSGLSRSTSSATSPGPSMPASSASTLIVGSNPRTQSAATATLRAPMSRWR